MKSVPFSTPLLVGSSNRGKVAEIAALARRHGVSIIGLGDESLKACGAAPRVPEVLASYEGNARLKGVEYSRWAGMPCLTDDSGIELPLLGGLPGVFTAPWGPARVRGMLGGQRVVAARFVCCMVYTEPNGRSVSVIAAVEGEVRDLQVSGADQSLPFSSFFYPKGFHRPLKELCDQGIFECSHRGRAFEALIKVLS